MKLSRRLIVLGSAVALAGAALTTGGTAAYGVTPKAADPAAVQAIAARNVDALLASRPAFLQASASDAFVPVGVATSSSVRYAAFERTYSGVPVVGGDFVVVTDAAGKVTFTSVALERPIGALSLAPRLSRAAAESVATAQLSAVSRVEGTRLVVYALDAAPRLAWESTVDGVGANGFSRLTVTVDAINGKVLDSLEHVAHGSGTAAWNGPNPVALNTTQSGSTFSMRDPTVTNLSCQDAANNTTFSGPDDLWGNGNATNRETGCVDALFGAQTEVKMLAQWLGRNAMDGSGGAWPIRVGLNDLNAFYDGTQVQIGHNQSNQWIGSIDVIAHEMGHGIDDHTPGRISRRGTQEFIADTFGASTEWFANESSSFDAPDFLVGETINLVGSGPIRNMYNPSLLGDPNCYSNSIPRTEVHAAAGPGNHWFYLLAEGTNPTNGQPTSPTCNGSTVTGLGVQTAIKILYNAMLMKTSQSSYLRYRVWTLQAAKNLTPGNCTAYNTVKAAWNAISVPAQSGEPACP
jgi:Zn-dependent metalloprotease